MYLHSLVPYVRLPNIARPTWTTSHTTFMRNPFLRFAAYKSHSYFPRLRRAQAASFEYSTEQQACNFKMQEESGTHGNSRTHFHAILGSSQTNQPATMSGAWGGRIMHGTKAAITTRPASTHCTDLPPVQLQDPRSRNNQPAATVAFKRNDPEQTTSSHKPRMAAETSQILMTPPKLSVEFWPFSV